MMCIEDLIERFVKNMGKSKAENTKKTYVLAVKDLNAYLQTNKNIEIENATCDDIIDYFTMLEDKGYKSTTLNNRINGLNMFFNYLKASGKITTNPMDIKTANGWYKEEQYESEYLEIDECKAIIKQMNKDIRYAKNERAKTVYIRNLAMFRLLVGTGCRISELLDIKLEDVDLENGWIVFPHRKNNVKLTVPLSTSIIDSIVVWLGVRKDLKFTDTTLFVSRNGKKLNRVDVNGMLKEYGEKCGIECNIHNHTLRHTCATLLLEDGEELTFVRDILGHKSIKTTERYGKTSNEHKKKLTKSKVANL